MAAHTFEQLGHEHERNESSKNGVCRVWALSEAQRDKALNVIRSRAAWGTSRDKHFQGVVDIMLGCDKMVTSVQTHLLNSARRSKAGGSSSR